MEEMHKMEELNNSSSNFILEAIKEDTENNRFGGKVMTRFPPEPNGYLHIGHAKAICVDFLSAMKFGGNTNLRLDDTNPSKEDTEYVDAIKEDINWLGFQWENIFYASDYFDKIYDLAVQLIKQGDAYVCELSPEQIREYRGTLTEPGKESPYRNRPIEESLDLFERMKNGEFQEGEMVLRAKIDMTSGNINMRDPIIYRIMNAAHHRTGDKWKIYPMYDFAHPLSDSIEGITHSLCTLEFEAHRPLYDWFLEKLNMPVKTRQIEFARLNITHTMMSKRFLLKLVTDKIVDGWDDPRMPTICGLRRRGYTPKSIRNFCDKIGVAKAASTVDMALLEHCIREDLNINATRTMAVIRPLKVVIDNYPDDLVEEFQVENNPEKPEEGTRTVKFSKEIYIEQDDFVEVPPNRKYFRMAPGLEVRLKSTYIVKCVDCVKDSEGNITEVHCTYDPDSRGGSAADGRKVRGTIQWVSAVDCIDGTVNLYESLFTVPDPASAENWEEVYNPDSLEVVTGCKFEPLLAECEVGSTFQFMRTGYFCKDKNSTPENPVFNRTVGLKDAWAKIANKG